MEEKNKGRVNGAIQVTTTVLKCKGKDKQKKAVVKASAESKIKKGGPRRWMETVKEDSRESGILNW